QRLAEERHNTQLEPEHLLYALTSQEGGVVPAVLEKLGVQPRVLLQRLQGPLDGFARTSTPGQLSASAGFRRPFAAAQSQAEGLKDEFASTEPFLLALSEGQGAGGQALRALGVPRDKVYQALQEVRGGQRVTSQNPESPSQALERYGRDLTAY